jgi:hypothetical protein
MIKLIAAAIAKNMETSGLRIINMAAMAKFISIK